MLKIEGYHLFDKRYFDSFNTIVMIYSYDSANQLLIPYNKKKNSTLWSLIQKRPEKMPRANEKKEREKNPNPETARLEFLVLSVSIEEKLIIN